MALALLAATQALLLGAVILTARGERRTENRLLAALVLTIGAMVGLNVVIRSPLIARLPHLIRVNHPIDFLPAPLFYLYVRALTGRTRLRPGDAVHALPAAACLMYLLPYYARSGVDKLADLHSSTFTTWYFVRSAAAILIAGPYIVLAAARAVRYVRAHRAGAQGPRAVVQQLNFLGIGFAIVLAIAAGRYVVDASFPAYMPVTSHLLPIAGTMMLVGMAYLALRDSPLMVLDGVRRYETSSLREDRAEQIVRTLAHALDVDRVYLDSTLTLNSLAERLGIPAPHLSQTINQRMNQNFTDLINGYRVAEAQRRLVDPAWHHYSIMGVAEDVGFRSKSSFNEVFKKATGTTPSDFRARYTRPDS